MDKEKIRDEIEVNKRVVAIYEARFDDPCISFEMKKIYNEMILEKHRRNNYLRDKLCKMGRFKNGGNK